MCIKYWYIVFELDYIDFSSDIYVFIYWYFQLFPT